MVDLYLVPQFTIYCIIDFKKSRIGYIDSSWQFLDWQTTLFMRSRRIIINNFSDMYIVIIGTLGRCVENLSVIKKILCLPITWKFRLIPTCHSALMV